MQVLATTERDLLNKILPSASSPLKPRRIVNENRKYHAILSKCRQLLEKRGVYSTITMNEAGFHYTGNADTARCEACHLEVSKWTLDMIPFTIHAQRSPTCSFVCSTKKSIAMSTNSTAQSILTSDTEETAFKHKKIEVTRNTCQQNLFVEMEAIKQIRQRTFSCWSQRASPSRAQMIEAGFFNCNVGDRVICIYCNIICQQWIPHSDNPFEVHETLSPHCPYVIATLKRSQASAIPVLNANSTNNDAPNNDFAQFDQLVTTAACHVPYREITKRYASFNTWPTENVPSVDDLVNAGFFFTGCKTIVTCFYCNGSLQNWTATDKPKIEHARWFPHCAYAKQLCGAELYASIEFAKQKRHQKSKSRNSVETSIGALCHGQLPILDENTLSKLVAARLDLPSSQSMLRHNFKLSVVKRCWEDQLRPKRDDFVSDGDLLMACTILQKQIKFIDGKKENIIIPSITMKRIHAQEQAETPVTKQTTPDTKLMDTSNDTDVEMQASSTSESSGNVSATDTNKKKDTTLDNANNLSQKEVDESSCSSSTNPCALCLTEDRCLAFVPCGHLATCVPCGHSVKSCPICRSEIKAFVRIYL